MALPAFDVMHHPAGGDSSPVASEHTSVPRAEEPVDLVGARSIILVMCDQSQPIPLPGGASIETITSCGGSGLADLAALLETATVGTRIVAVGSEVEVYQVRDSARRAGAIDEEIRLIVTDRTSRRVYCSHCRAHTRTNEPIGATVTCSACARTLHIYHHFSRVSAAYLGYMSDAETVR